MPTHEVVNQPPPLEDRNLYLDDAPLRAAIARTDARDGEKRLIDLGARAGSAGTIELGFQANRNPPQLRAFDRYGHRIDEIDYHPAYHALMRLGLEAGVSAVAWTAPGGGHVLHSALMYLMSQVEPGVCCPFSMTYACVPALRREPEVAGAWVPRVTSARYDGRVALPAEKAGCTVGMAMTEKQGGSDVRSNTTRAVRDAGADDAAGGGEVYRLTGHKWFCSAAMSDAFLTLAQTAAGLTCFLAPKLRPDGSRNAIEIQRLKDKLGDRANASSEIEYREAFAWRVGEEGRGVATILEMVHHTRLDCLVAPAGFIRQAVAQAVWHARHRMAFGRLLIDQPLMRRVLADLLLESEATTALAFRVAHAFDRAAAGDERETAFGRLATPVAKYLHNKRVIPTVGEAMECLGGAGYVEESVLPRLYRQAPLNGIWEGSGNVICLDVLRAAGRAPESVEAVLGELGEARGADADYDRALDALARDVASIGGGPGGGVPADTAAAAGAAAGARGLVERIGLLLQAAELLRHRPDGIGASFCRARLGAGRGATFGATEIDEAALLGAHTP